MTGFPIKQESKQTGGPEEVGY